MNTSEIEYLTDLRTRAVHMRSGNALFTDAPIDNQGKGEFFSPTDLVATALGTCMLTLMGITARNHQIEMDGSLAGVKKIMAENPRRISRIEILIRVNNPGLNDKQKAMLENAARNCPVAKSLNVEIEQDVNFLYS